MTIAIITIAIITIAIITIAIVTIAIVTIVNLAHRMIAVILLAKKGTVLEQFVCGRRW